MRHGAYGAAFRPAYAPRAYGYGRPAYRHAWRGRAAYGAGVAAAGYAYGGGYGYASSGYSSDYSYGQSYGYAPASTSYSRTYAVPTTVYQPVTRTSYVPVTSYQAVQSTSYVPTTAYRQVTQTCTCTVDGVTQQVPCGSGYVGGNYVRGVGYNRPGLFTSGW
jgi:hypothetical protein